MPFLDFATMDTSPFLEIETETINEIINIGTAILKYSLPPGTTLQVRITFRDLTATHSADLCAQNALTGGPRVLLIHGFPSTPDRLGALRSLRVRAIAARCTHDKVLDTVNSNLIALYGPNSAEADAEVYVQLSFRAPASRLDGVIVFDEGECVFGAAVRGPPWERLAMVGVPRMGVCDERWDEVGRALSGLLRCVSVIIAR